jgi:hypothetical protein
MRPCAERRARSAAGDDGRSYGPSRRSLGPNRVHDIEYARASACPFANPLAQSSACAVGLSVPGLHVRRADHQLRKIRGSVVRSGVGPPRPCRRPPLSTCAWLPSQASLRVGLLGLPSLPTGTRRRFHYHHETELTKTRRSDLMPSREAKEVKAADFGDLKIR